MKRQWANSKTRPPIEGARIGAAPITSISRDIRMAAACPSARSRTTARGITMLAEAAKAETARKPASQAIEGASAQPTQARVKPAVPIISGRRRPNRSETVPWVICPTARPANQEARVSCAVPGALWKRGLHRREGGQVHVGGARPDGDEEAEQSGEPGGRFHGVGVAERATSINPHPHRRGSARNFSEAGSATTDYVAMFNNPIRASKSPGNGHRSPGRSGLPQSPPQPRLAAVAVPPDSPTTTARPEPR